ncbi:MAG: matrixin family metalloprotease [Nocardioides sp.]
MHIRPRPWQVVAPIMVGATLLWGQTAVEATVTDEPSASCPTVGLDGTLTAAEADGEQSDSCNLVDVLVVVDGQGVPIPEAGTEVTLSDFRIDGVESILSVEVSADGTIAVDIDADPSPRPADDASGPCMDDYTIPLLGKKWYPADMPMDWSINLDTIPTGDIKEGNAVDAIRSAMGNITSARNTCGMDDTVAASANYQGDTNTVARISQTACNSNGEFCTTVCPASDEWNGVNTVSFGERRYPVVASTCSKAVAHDGPNRIVEAEMKIDKTWATWTRNGNASTCTSDLDLESVITHEFGHWYGVGHSNGGAAYASLTMFPSVFRCDNNYRTLGAPDVRSLRQYY